MKYVFFVFSFLFAGAVSMSGQTGAISVYYWNSKWDWTWEDAEKVAPASQIFLLDERDSLLTEHFLLKRDSMYYFSHLAPGVYHVVIQAEGVYKADQQVRVKNDTMYVDFRWNEPRVYRKKESELELGGYDSNDWQVTYSLLYAPGTIGTSGNYPISGGYGLGVGILATPWRLKPHVYGLAGLHFSATYYAYKAQDTLARRQRILALQAEPIAGLRFSSNARNSMDPDAKWIDLGMKYNFPLFFRYAAIDGDTRITHKGIHQYTNFSAFARVGIKSVAAFSEYRLFNYVIAGFPEMPRWTFGLQWLLVN